VGSVNLINESVRHSVKCFVFTSSIAVYGKNQLPMSENLIPEPEDPYGIAKLAVEMDLRVAHEMFGLNYIIFRPHNVYGERQNIGDKYRNVLGIFMNNVLLGKDILVFGDGEQTRAFSYIDDITPIIASAVDVPEAYNQIFNIGADTSYSVNQLVKIVLKEMGFENAKINYEPARNEVMHAFSDHTKLKKVFNVSKAETSLEEGINRMVRWVKDNGARTSKDFDDIEIEKNLPQSWLKGA